MHYVAVVDGEEREVEIIEVSPGRYQLTMEGRRLDCDVHEVSESTLSCILDDEAYNIEFERDRNGGENCLVRGNVLHVEVLDLRRMRLRKATTSTAGAGGPATVTSPMPGKVVAILVKEGQQVTEGQGLVIVEAMKMENELRASRDGVVKNLIKEEGVAVDAGVALCVVE